MGAAKAELSVGKTAILSLLAGVYISLGGLAMLSVGGATPALASVRAPDMAFSWKLRPACIHFAPLTAVIPPRCACLNC